MRPPTFVLVVGAMLAGCDSGPEERPAISSTRAVQRPHALPPEGSVPRGSLARRAALAPPGPDVTPALLARGRDVYGAFCVPCHGRGGAGDGPAVARGFPAPPSLSDPRYAELSLARIVEVVTDGAGRMYPMADRLEPPDRWAVSHHVHELRAGR